MNQHQDQLKEIAATMMQIKSTPYESFNTVHVADQPYAEIPRSYAIRWKDHLDETWHLVDAHGNHHIVKYNKSLENARIGAGWPSIREHYQLGGNCQITLTHYGQSFFLISVYKTNSEAHAFPKWHSLYRQNPNSVVFHVLLNEYKISASALDVPSTMYYFLKDRGFTNLIFEGTSLCKIVFNHWRKSAKIGAGWKAFAKDNNLKANFEFIIEFPYPTNNIVRWSMR